jgi:Ca2+-transporting ATPase
MVFMGTFIVQGRAVAYVKDIGMSTKFGAIASLISGQEKTLPLQDKINALAKVMVGVGILAALITGTILLVRSGAVTSTVIVETVFVMIAIAVAAFPESFPVVLLSTLSAGAHRMARQNAIVNRMSVIETLGETTVICSDKTGTITKGEMTVKKAYVDGMMFEVTGEGYSAQGGFEQDGKKVHALKHPIISKLCTGAALCNDASIMEKGSEGAFTITGSPTEASLLVMAAKAGIFRDDMQAERVQEVPFSSERKIMSVLIKRGRENIVYMKGAPEHVIERCTHIERSNGVYTLTQAQRKQWLAQNAALNDLAFRTLAIAYKPAKSLSRNEEHGFVLLGLVALEDPPRDSVQEALRLCTQAGITVKMITGDHEATARSIAQQIGLRGNIMRGDELDAMNDEQLRQCVQNVTVFARVKPEHKLRIVNALKERGEVVTMTGDGVNDAPALKAAHIGVAMGKNGTDVSRAVADLTLRDDNFSTIVKAVEEGRAIFSNMRKFVTYSLSCTVAEITIILLAIILGLPLPLVAIQILFMNLVTSDLPAIALGLNPSSKDSMEHPPRRTSRILHKDHVKMLVIAAVVLAAGALGVFAISLKVLGQSVEMARTSALVTLIFYEVINAFNFRSFRKGTLTRSPLVNKYLLVASVVSLAATWIVVQTPVNAFFETTPLGATNWIMALIPSIVILILFDVLKHLNEKKGFWKDVS